VAFLGAAYFRSIGALNQYGLSARGVTVDVAAPTPEEFPDFTHFWIEPALGLGEPVMVYALMDGPGITGAFRFAIRRTEGAVMDVDAALFTRRAIERLGIAPLTSMFWFAEYDRPELFDWRPEVHDSDGLALWTGVGERIWRPLNNPGSVVVSAFGDTNPRGFGLLQRDREFEHYLDGVNYDRRPSLWVEPLGEWGTGTIQLVEIPTDDEIHDNVVAFWVPEAPVEAGDEFRFAYRLHWLADEPYLPENVARTFATRIGRGGEPGKPRPEGVIKFVVEFAGGPLPDLAEDVEPEARITASRGKISYVFAEPIAETGRWRAQFDLTVDDAEPVELRLYLADGERPLTETWLYQYRPRPS
jgi:glucans biosynthesis protein